jgi:hypothetical protein
MPYTLHRGDALTALAAIPRPGERSMTRSPAQATTGVVALREGRTSSASNCPTTTPTSLYSDCKAPPRRATLNSPDPRDESETDDPGAETREGCVATS